VRPQWWWTAAPVVVAGLGAAYAIGANAVDPYPHAVVGTAMTGPGRVGDTYYVNLDIGPVSDGAHLTSVTAAGVHGVRLGFRTTTFDRIGHDMRAGFPLRCAGPASTSPVPGTPLRRDPATYLRVDITPTEVGRVGFSSLTLHWRDGLFHGSDIQPFSYHTQATTAYRSTC
jgi:hypothetical protein